MGDKIDVLAVMDSLQFGFNHRRCPMCAGWNVGPNGETDKMHTYTCPVPKARAAIAELIEADREYDRASRAWDQGRFTEWEGISDESRQKICADFEGAIMRRHDALASVGGAK